MKTSGMNLRKEGLVQLKMKQDSKTSEDKVCSFAWNICNQQNMKKKAISEWVPIFFALKTIIASQATIVSADGLLLHVLLIAIFHAKEQTLSSGVFEPCFIFSWTRPSFRRFMPLVFIVYWQSIPVIKLTCNPSNCTSEERGWTRSVMQNFNLCLTHGFSSV